MQARLDELGPERLNCGKVHDNKLTARRQRSVARPNSPLWVKGPLEEQTNIGTGVYDAWIKPRGDLYLERD